jgi:uncharacterized protein
MGETKIIAEQHSSKTVTVNVKNIERNEAFRESTSAKMLELIVNPTEKCNFRCVYCYEKFELGNMKPDVVMGVKNLILNRSTDLAFLKISWFGGEPMLGYNGVMDIMEYSGSLCKFNGDGATLKCPLAAPEIA